MPFKTHKVEEKHNIRITYFRLPLKIEENVDTYSMNFLLFIVYEDYTNI